MKNKRNYFFNKILIIPLLLVLIVLSGCELSKKEGVDVSDIKLDIKVLRFDQEFANVKPTGIPQLKKKFPYMFPKQYADSVWESKLKDTLQAELFKEVDNSFLNFTQETKDLELFYKHVKYYFPKEKEPNVVTVTSYVDYKNRVILTDTILLLALDNYLGANHKFYAGIQNYIAKTLDKQYIVSDVASAFVKKKIAAPVERTFLAKLIYYGKELYLKDKLIPFNTDAQKIKFTQQELDWANANEEQIWRYFVERQLLYSTDAKLAARFLEDAPFSKFQLELDNESPGKVGRYIGWQIVKAYMEKNKVSLQQLLSIPAEEIFKKSNYKPRR